MVFRYFVSAGFVNSIYIFIGWFFIFASCCFCNVWSPVWTGVILPLHSAPFSIKSGTVIGCKKEWEKLKRQVAGLNNKGNGWIFRYMRLVLLVTFLCLAQLFACFDGWVLSTVTVMSFLQQRKLTRKTPVDRKQENLYLTRSKTNVLKLQRIL